MHRTLSVPRAVALALLVVGCDTTYHARLTDGAGLAEGAPVLVSGVRVGEVRAVRLVEGEVEVELSVSSEHELSLREDTCAMAVRADGGATSLALSMGTGPLLPEPRTIPQCQLRAGDLGGFLRTLGEGFGDLLRQLGGGLGSGGGTGPAPNPLPSPPPLRDPTTYPPAPPSDPLPAPSPANEPPPSEPQRL